MYKKALTVATALSAGVLLALAAPLAASAHVTIGTNQAAAGSYPLIDFKVPTESATATTTKVDVTIPQATPFGSVTYVPVEGWTTQLVTETLDTPIETDDGSVTEAVTHVIWTAQPGSELTSEQYGVFPLSVGPVPDTGSIVLAVDQTYSDGTVVSWSDTSEDGEHPAPVLYVNDAPPAGDHHGGDAATDDDHGAMVEAHDDDASSGADTLARLLGIGGLVVGAVGIVVAVTSRRKTAA
ncbi:YcnI family protein [soil metagenome]